MRKMLVFALVTVIGLAGMSCLNPVNNDNPNGNTVTTNSTRIAVTTVAFDFSAANFEIVSTADHSVHPNLLNGLHTDHAARSFGGDVYILERYGKDNVIKYNPKSMATVYQQNLGTGLNLQDIAVVSKTKAYISSHNSSGLIIFDPSSGTKVSAIDLSRFNTYAGTDSAETSPFTSALAVYGDYLYAACQRLKTVQEVWGTNIVPGDTSLIAVIDIRADAIVGGIALNKKNPVSMDIFGGRMLVSSSGNWYDAASGGVEVIDLSGNINTGIVVDGDKFGGSVSDVVFVSMDKAYIAVGKMSDDFSRYWTEIVPFDPSTGAVGAKLGGIGNGFGGLVWDGSRLYVGDREPGASGVAVINPETGAVERKVPTGMPPSSLAIIYNNY